MFEISFCKEFTARLLEIEARAKAVGSNMTQVCRATEIARPTFERWGHRPPQTIRKLDELDAEVTRLEGLPSTKFDLESEDQPVVPPAEKDLTTVAWFGSNNNSKSVNFSRKKIQSEYTNPRPLVSLSLAKSIIRQLTLERDTALRQLSSCKKLLEEKPSSDASE